MNDSVAQFCSDKWTRKGSIPYSRKKSVKRVRERKRSVMSMKPHGVPPIPEETVRLARESFPKGTFCLFLRDELGTIYHDEQFALLFSKRGQPAEAPWRLAVVTVLQYIYGLTDRDAADAVAGRLEWKYLLSLPPNDHGFDFTVLSAFRERLVEANAQDLLLDPLLQLCEQRGWLKAGGKQRTDSTHVLSAVRQLSSAEAVGEALRAALFELAEQQPQWLVHHIPLELAQRYEDRVELRRFARQARKREGLIKQIGADSGAVLQALHQAHTPQAVTSLSMVRLFETVWGQHYEWREGKACWRDGPGQLNGERIVSPYDEQARASSKRELKWTGYKVHVSETCEPSQPHLITQVSTTAATVQDVEMTQPILEALQRAGRAPHQWLLDTGYTSADLLVWSGSTRIVGRVSKDTSWQAQERKGYALADFQIDWPGKQATCPQGVVSSRWKERMDKRGDGCVVVSFEAQECQQCPARAHCTHQAQEGRTLTLHLQREQEALSQRRQEQGGVEFGQIYALRAGVEATISAGVRRYGLRQSRYRGLKKTQVQHSATAAAMNLVRLQEWMQQEARGSGGKPTRSRPTFHMMYEHWVAA